MQVIGSLKLDYVQMTVDGLNSKPVGTNAPGIYEDGSLTFILLMEMKSSTSTSTTFSSSTTSPSSTPTSTTS